MKKRPRVKRWEMTAEEIETQHKKESGPERAAREALEFWNKAQAAENDATIEFFRASNKLHICKFIQCEARKSWENAFNVANTKNEEKTKI